MKTLIAKCCLVLFVVCMAIVIGALIALTLSGPTLELGPIHINYIQPQVVICQPGDEVCMGNPYGFPLPNNP